MGEGALNLIFQVLSFLPLNLRAILLPGQRNSFFLCLFTSQEGSFGQGPRESRSVLSLAGPWLFPLTSYLGEENVTTPAT